MIRSTYLLVLAFASLLPGCSQSPDQQASKTAVPAPIAVSTLHGAAVIAALADQTQPLMTVHKSPSCGCCGLWIEHMNKAGFPVSTVAMNDLGPLKVKLGVPAGGGSCHTATVGGYFIEGHVPAADIQRLLTERPKARGLTVPGMVMGSPGMEVPTGEVKPYTVYLVDLDGNSTPFSHHNR